MLTPREFAEAKDVTRDAVMVWIKTGKLKAKRHETLRGPAYLIPETELARFQTPKAGRPRKAGK